MTQQAAPLDVVVEAESDQFDQNDPGWRAQLVALRRALQDADVDDVRREERAAPGHKAGLEVIIVALGTSGAITAAVEVFRSWLSRDRERKLRLKFRDGDREVTVEVEADKASDDTMVAALTSALENLSSHE